jgi:hypothetical protein
MESGIRSWPEIYSAESQTRFRANCLLRHETVIQYQELISGQLVSNLERNVVTVSREGGSRARECGW